MKAYVRQWSGDAPVERIYESDPNVVKYVAYALVRLGEKLGDSTLALCRAFESSNPVEAYQLALGYCNEFNSIEEGDRAKEELLERLRVVSLSGGRLGREQ